jgi:hypothetical protein
MQTEINFVSPGIFLTFSWSGLMAKPNPFIWAHVPKFSTAEVEIVHKIRRCDEYINEDGHIRALLIVLLIA